MKRISLVIAMLSEAEPLIALLGLKKHSLGAFYDQLQFQIYSGVYKNKIHLSLILPGLDPRYQMDSIGTEPATVAAFIAIKELSPNIIISAGTAGSFKAVGAKVGKVYLSDKQFYFHDHRIPIPGWKEYGEGHYPSLNVKKMADELSIEVADVSSGSSLDFTDQDLNRIKENNAKLKEMEAAGVAWIAFVTHTPMFAIKSVTNLIDENQDSATEFTKNFAIAVESLTQTVVQTLDYLSVHDLF
jgi:nucleoside phosphorylase